MIKDYEDFKKFILQSTTIDLNAYKERQMKRRIDTLISRNKYDGYDSYSQAIKKDKKLMDNLNATKDSFVDVSDGIAVSRQETSVIESNADSCNEARKQIDDVVTNLSAISQQNAASAQQTTASMEELSATIGTLADTANDLMKISEQLNMEVSFFKVR